MMFIKRLNENKRKNIILCTENDRNGGTDQGAYRALVGRIVPAKGYFIHNGRDGGEYSS
ncbi:MAG: hypothetical protein NC543_03375 [bacterium]|nr:hypothetical protein [bacterium]MCM1373902.1 hypothetical protein [Muribaculum sp.]